MHRLLYHTSQPPACLYNFTATWRWRPPELSSKSCRTTSLSSGTSCATSEAKLPARALTRPLPSQKGPGVLRRPLLASKGLLRRRTYRIVLSKPWGRLARGSGESSPLYLCKQVHARARSPCSLPGRGGAQNGPDRLGAFSLVCKNSGFARRCLSMLQKQVWMSEMT